MYCVKLEELSTYNMGEFSQALLNVRTSIMCALHKRWSEHAAGADRSVVAMVVVGSAMVGCRMAV